MCSSSQLFVNIQQGSSKAAACNLFFWLWLNDGKKLQRNQIHSHTFKYRCTLSHNNPNKSYTKHYYIWYSKKTILTVTHTWFHSPQMVDDSPHVCFYFSLNLRMKSFGKVLDLYRSISHENPNTGHSPRPRFLSPASCHFVKTEVQEPRVQQIPLTPTSHDFCFPLLLSPEYSLFSS